MLLESVSSIENNFWSSDKTALNILLDKLEQSNKTTIVIQEFFNQRARIEEEYGNQLLKLSETLINDIPHEENFNIISNTTEMSARAHIDLSQNIRNLLELPLDDFLKDQENIKSFMTNQMKESQNMKMLHGDNVKKTRQLYINECQKSNPSYKDIDVLDFEYQKAINLMQSNSHSWIHDWRESCKTFQSLESNRLDYLKAVIKTFSSMTACTYSIDDQTCDRLITVMDDINVNGEISKFITNHGTGSTLPDIPKYTKYKRDVNNSVIGEGDGEKNIKIISANQKTRTIKEINIPIKHDEQLRSVNDQLKKIPSPWDNSANKLKVNKWNIVEEENTSMDEKINTTQTSFPPHQYPLDPIYKSTRKNPSRSDPILNNFTFQQDDKLANHNINKSTLVTPYEEKKYQSTQQNPHHYLPWSTNNNPNNNNTITTKQVKTPTSPIKKSSLLFSPLGFLKKKKVVAVNTEEEPKTSSNNKKRLSLGHISTTAKKSTSQSHIMLPPTNNNRNSSSSVLTPPSPMFSQMDFYYSPSSADNNNHDLQTSSPQHIC